jgi:hypothetical protein
MTKVTPDLIIAIIEALKEEERDEVHNRLAIYS